MQLGFHTDAFEQLDVGDVDGKSGPEVPKPYPPPKKQYKLRTPNSKPQALDPEP